MCGKSICILLAALLAFTAADTNNKRFERQSFPEQFSEFSNYLQEAFGNQNGENQPQLPTNFIPNGFLGQGLQLPSRSIDDVPSFIKNKIPSPMGLQQSHNN